MKKIAVIVLLGLGSLSVHAQVTSDTPTIPSGPNGGDQTSGTSLPCPRPIAFPWESLIIWLFD